MSSKQQPKKQVTQPRSAKEQGGAPAPRVSGGGSSFQLEHPTLDPHHKSLLNSRSSDFDKDLAFIETKFFPGGSLEVKYGVYKDDGKVETLSAFEYNLKLRKKKEENKEKNELSLLHGFHQKMAKRCLIRLPDDLSTADLRKISAGEPLMVPAMTSILNKTQAAMSSAGLNNPDAILGFWNRQPKEVKEAMDKYQALVFRTPTRTWSANLNSENEKRQAELARAAVKKSSKLLAVDASASGGSILDLEPPDEVVNAPVEPEAGSSEEVKEVTKKSPPS